ncbi:MULTISPECIES: GNAT family N-acetyltransferase [Streptomyces]|uniref:GNAT family N-acetyltransferase n=1 Tax=Streptomyces TaxID=1883 RepID=UPI00141612A1|nr:GNAT family N-acetyltransferase [Streptomyces sp. SID7805]MYU51650.1 GNAT family N-acetyltransferase [Streptomyces sp. SID7805]
MLLNLGLGNQRIQVRDLEPRDENDVLALFGAAEDWFVAATGRPAAPGDVQSLYYGLPEGAAFEDKALLVITADGRVVGVIDAVLRHPTAESCSLGLFLVHPAHRRHGLGRLTASALLGELASQGCTDVGASVAEGWQPGLKFLGALGFSFESPRTPANANRNLGPGERRIIPAGLRLWPGR